MPKGTKINGSFRESINLACVDIMSGWIYYTPTYALQEFICGNDLETITKTRVIGLAAQAIAMRPVGMLRDYVANKKEITEESKLIDKMKVNLIAVTSPQSVIYAGMLLGGMAWSGEYNWGPAISAWAVGTSLGAIHSLAYGPFQDIFRKKMKVEPAIKPAKSLYNLKG